MEHSRDNAADSLKQAVKKRPVFKEEMAEGLVNSKHEVPVGAADQLEGHFCGAVDGILVAAGGAELGMAAERDRFKRTTMWAAIQGGAIGWVPAVDYFRDVFHNNVPGMKGILNDLIIVFENLL